MSTIRVRELARGISTPSCSVIVRALEDMALFTIVVCTIAETRKGTTNRSGRRYIDVRVAACIIGAVAA
jgi:hypothetical protein